MPGRLHETRRATPPSIQELGKQEADRRVNIRRWPLYFLYRSDLKLMTQ